ncbi:MAG TPA: hypothetical protein VEI28_03650 [Thermodesulfovibrionales bacterium]|nr:hypothetical protein [Thermodesulfovibrionales bacterium]
MRLPIRAGDLLTGPMAYGRVLAAIFLFSFASLAFEIALTRLFSISLWYHFGFMVISISMLGIGASGTVLSLFPKLKNSSLDHPIYPAVGTYGLLLGASMTFSYVIANALPFDPVRLSWDRTQLFYILLYYLLLSVPFFFFGLIISISFSAISRKAGLLYAADLLGAGAGSLGFLLLTTTISTEHAVIVLSSMALTGALVTGRGRTRIGTALFLAANAFLFCRPDLITPRMSAYKGLQSALKYPGAVHLETYNDPFSRVDLFESPAVRFAPGLSLTYLDSLPSQIGLSIDGSDINAITSAENKGSLKFLSFLPSALPYFMATRDDVLILEPKGGLQVVLARYYNAQNIYKVDSNPLVIKVIRDHLRDFSQGIYERNTWDGLGRSWLRTREIKFNLIDIPLVATSPSGFFGISEDYRFTVEAFKEYLGRLKEGGILSLHLFILPPPRIELRLLSTLVTSMEEMGLTEVDKKIISFRSWDTLGILAKPVPFTPEEIEAVRQFTKQRRFDLIHLPGIQDTETNTYVRLPSNEYFFTFKQILDPKTRRSFEENYLFDIRPVRDENPFFHYYLKIKNLRKIYHLMGSKWQYLMEEGYLLPAVFVQVLLLSTMLISLPAVAKLKSKAEGGRRVKKENKPTFVSDLLYFAFLGLGFMLVEIALIQKMILPLENPSYAIATVLASILVSSGTGSLIGDRLSLLGNSLILPIISLLIILCSILLPSISHAISPYPMPLRIACVFFVLFLPCSLMGIPFPLGIKNLGTRTPDMIPWAWATNGCLSVLAPLMAVMLAMLTGFNAVLWIGAGAYIFAFLTFPAPSSAPRQS